MNPFIYSGASNLTEDQVIDSFVQDHNYSRFIQSQRNVFLWGERGSGKTMTLLYNRIQMKKALSEGGHDVSFIPVYTSCITPLVFKREYLLLENDFKASVVSEHYLVLSLALSLANTLIDIDFDFTDEYFQEIEDEISYILDQDLPPGKNIFDKLRKYLRKEFSKTQREINRSESDSFFEDTFTFSSLVLPLMELFKDLPGICRPHFVLMLDDAHDLNKFQRSALNSWIAYRDNSFFSFKISAAKIVDYDLSTSTGGSILAGHDYVAIDLEKPYQNDDSSFGHLAKRIIERRLKICGYEKSADEFFPISPSMEDDLNEYRIRARQDALNKYSPNQTKEISDYVYKYYRAYYFRERDSRANRPKYSGFETITHLSSGVIRNLLEPCYWMYEDALSKSKENDDISEIDPITQSEVIQRLSNNLWERIRDGIDKQIVDCTRKQAEQIERLFNELAKLFRKRLLDKTCSEPRVITFTISVQTDSIMEQLNPILDISTRALLLYRRSGNAKDDGANEYYFSPNRMLWPSRGLDPVGQHGRVSIQAKHLLNAAVYGLEIPFKRGNNSSQVKQGDIFDG